MKTKISIYALILITMIVVAFAINAASQKVVTNPPLIVNGTCGLDVVLLLDSSDSINSSELQEVRDAANAFVTSLADTSSNFSVIDFDTQIKSSLPFTNDISAITAAINSIDHTSATELTNWHAAFTQAHINILAGDDPNHANLVIIITDGDPTTYGYPTSLGRSSNHEPDPEDINYAIQAANSLKENGTRILAIGISANPTIRNLINISGPIVNSGDLTSDVITTNISDLADALAAFSQIYCGQTDLSITNSGSVNLVYPGDSLTYTIQVTNQGQHAAYDVNVVDVLPAEVVFVNANPVPTSGSFPTYTWNIPSILSGETVNILVNVTINNSANPGIITNTVKVYNNTYDPLLENNIASEDTTVGSAADLSIIKSDSADPVHPGEIFNYNITITNNGPDAAANVRVNDTLPQGVSYISANPAPASVVGSTLTWVFDSISSGDSLDIVLTVQVKNIASTVLTNIAQVISDTHDNIPQNNIVSVDTTVGGVADLSIVKSASADPVYYSETFTYTIEVTNNGPDIAANVKITDTLPQEVSFISSNEPCQNKNSNYTWNFSSIAVGETKTIIILVLVETTNIGTITNNAQVTSDTIDPSLENNIASEDTYFDSSAELSVIKTCDTKTVIAGGNIAYTINVTNHGPNTAENIIVIDTLPAEVKFVSSNPQPSQNKGQIYQWNITSLDAYQSFIITLNATINNGTVGTISNHVTVISDTHDTKDENNNDTENTTVKGVADISIQKTSNAKKPIYAEDKITYTLNITNYGPDQALNVNITDILPQGVTFTNSTIEPNGNNNSKYYWIISSINANESVIIKINVTIIKGFSGIITNTAYITEESYDPQKENNQDDLAITVSKKNVPSGGGGGGGSGGVIPVIIIDQKPTAIISGPYFGTPNEEIQFNATKSHDNDEGGQIIVRFDWKFLDDQEWQENLGATPKYIYTQPGIYTVTLRIFDNENNSDTNTTTVTIIKPNSPPTIPDINGPENGITNVSYNFTVVSSDKDGDELKYTIDWGDETTTVSDFLPAGTVFNAAHKWIKPETYKITVTASDNNTISTDELTIKIDKPNKTKETIFPWFLLFLILFFILLLIALLEKRRRDKKKQEQIDSTAKKASTKQ